MSNHTGGSYNVLPAIPSPPQFYGPVLIDMSTSYLARIADALEHIADLLARLEAK